ncbi:MAG: hypothetical protein QOE11_1082 [Solirubrobacteraceae bacterium]|jgi:uncharacterized protein YkwD|nr:hypothetical protein [Solirubrobacteraceae bacterium]
MLRRRSGARVIALLAGVFVLHAGMAHADAVAGCAGAAIPAVDESSRGRAALAVLCLLNRERTSRGLRAVRLSRELDSAARFHSADMVQRRYFGHDGPRGDTLGTRVRRAGYAASHPRFGVGEALAWGRFVTPDLLVRALIHSARHRRILLDPRARDLGIGLTLGAPAVGVAQPSSTLVLDLGQ